MNISRPFRWHSGKHIPTPIAAHRAAFAAIWQSHTPELPMNSRSLRIHTSRAAKTHELRNERQRSTEAASDHRSGMRNDGVARA